ncbi:MAG TPA: hypothetical protein VK679_03615 [Gemmatimonadaceae bacterium]|jgi:hypothetical protein|nr:hypothetical protein [Gemmatimonadaceae bacterium]
MDMQLFCTDLGRAPEVRNILSKATGRRTTDDGVIVEFPDDDATVRTLLEFVLAERRCCAHFTYEMAFAPALTLTLRASGIYLAPLQAMYGP